jgi:hypothetical protein
MSPPTLGYRKDVFLKWAKEIRSVNRLFYTKVKGNFSSG